MAGSHSCLPKENKHEEGRNPWPTGGGKTHGRCGRELLADLETSKRGTLYCKVSPKGGMSLYGLQRMPVTLYIEQWERLLAFADDLRRSSKSTTPS